jgi:hypothetical protein
MLLVFLAKLRGYTGGFLKFSSKVVVFLSPSPKSGGFFLQFSPIAYDLMFWS